ncbi:MAG: hypothetical protein IID08_08840 [Candidatus Hydrogenedentes bacterium]|nr:hypothetical protein [Candidatus Hydrogenedentota bacterium]
MMKRVIAGILVTVATLGVAAICQNNLDALRAERLEEELLYFPNEKLLTHLTAGLDSIAADLLWLRTIKYTVAEFHNPQRKFLWLEHMCTTVAVLDPYFEDAYVFGGTFMASIGADDRALEFLKSGLVNNPDSWKIPFEIAKIFLLNRRDEPESLEQVIHYLTLVAERSDDPEFFMNWIHKIQAKGNLSGEARSVWEEVAKNSTDEFMRELARSKLTKLDIGDTITIHKGALDRFRAARGRSPAHLDELVRAGYLTGLPTHPDHGRYFLDRNGDIRNSILVESRSHELRTILARHIQAFKQEKSRYPDGLAELEDYMGAPIPPHPDELREWEYDPLSGTLD